MTKKYSIPVYLHTSASHCIGTIECDSVDEYYIEAEKLWEEQEYDAPSTNVSNDFDLGDWDLDEAEERDLNYYTNKG